jgi:hypothetical protein
MSSGTVEKLLTPAELAERWQLSGKRPVEHVYRMTRQGRIPAGVVVKLGRYYRYRLEGIEEFERNGGRVVAPVLAGHQINYCAVCGESAETLCQSADAGFRKPWWLDLVVALIGIVAALIGLAATILAASV